jgi:hypothetical protein
VLDEWESFAHEYRVEPERVHLVRRELDARAAELAGVGGGSGDH